MEKEEIETLDINEEKAIFDPEVEINEEPTTPVKQPSEPQNIKPKKHNIKVIIVLVILIILVGAGLFLKIYIDNQNQKLENTMTKYAADYYDKYTPSRSNSSAYKITLADLKRANQERGENYDLTQFDKCDENKTYATISIDYLDGKITETVIKLDCKLY